MLEELSVMRDRLDRATELLLWSFDIREQLDWQFDLYEMRGEVDLYKRAVEAHKRWQT
jgi:hypothetical protein